MIDQDSINTRLIALIDNMHKRLEIKNEEIAVLKEMLLDLAARHGKLASKVEVLLRTE